MSSGFPVRAQWNRTSKRASNCGSTFSEYCATKPDKQLYSIYTCCRLLLLLLSAGAAPTAELATMQTASLARSLAPKALFQKPPKTPSEEEEMGLPIGGNAVPSSGGRADRGTAEHKRGYKNPYNTTGRGAIFQKKKKKKVPFLFSFALQRNKS